MPSLGERPFEHGERDAADPIGRWPQLNDDPRALPDHVGPAVAQPIMSCLAPEPADRPTAGELADLLEPVLGALPRPKLSRLKPRIQRYPASSGMCRSTWSAIVRRTHSCSAGVAIR